MKWVVAADLVADSLSPGFYDLEFVELERILSANKERYVALGDLLRPVWTPVPVPGTFAWVAVPYEEGIEVADAARSPLTSGFALPREALLVSRKPDRLRTILWREDIWGGSGAANPGLTVLEPASGESIAWLERELKEVPFQQQIRRAVGGSAFGLLHVSDLLRIRVRNLPIDARRSASEIVLQELKLARNQDRLDRLKGVAGLTALTNFPGATFEDRRQQFERYLAEDADAVPLAFVEASTTNVHADLFAVRPLVPALNEAANAPRFGGAPDSNAERTWREWYWEGSENACRIYHATATESRHRLPTDLFGRLAPFLLAVQNGFTPGVTLMERWKRVSTGQLFLPGPERISQLLEAGAQADSDLISALREGIGRFVDFADLAEEPRAHLVYDVYTLLRRLLRPVLAVRIVKSRRTVGVYFVAWNSDVSESNLVDTRLVNLGTQLLRLLEPPEDFVEAAARKESMRRLSWLGHQLNNPLGRAEIALLDVLQCLERHPAIASMLVPDPSKAEGMAAMSEQPLKHYTMQFRVETARQAFDDIRRVSGQIRMFSRTHAEFALAACNLRALVEAEIQSARQSLLGLQIQVADLPDVELLADGQQLRQAFQQVFSNAIRELEVRNVNPPAMTVKILPTEDYVRVEIQDNGLPALMDLIENPFREDASTYATQGKGTGLGLTIVREIILRHRGECKLVANRDQDNDRIPGVTFTCDLPFPGKQLAGSLYEEL